MNKLRLLAAIATCLLAMPAYSDSGVYIGAGYGEVSYKGNVDTNGLVDQTYSEIPLTSIDEGEPIREGNRVISSDDSDSAWKIFGGYSFNRYIAIEGAYADLGSGSASILTDQIEALSTAGEGGEGVYRGSQRTNFSYEAQVISVSARGTIPLGDWFRLYGKIGASYYDTESSRSWLTAANKTVPGQETVDASDTSPASRESNSGTSWLYGIGAGFDFAGNWGVDVEYESYQDVDLGRYVSKDSIDMISVSVQYRF